MEAKVKVMQEFSLVTFYNTRHDCDNLSMIAKVLVDCMKDRYVVDDTNSVYKSTHTIFDPKLPRGVVEFHLIGK
jgi:Holliday junction resolvase RusA-like endonuclease